MYVLLQLYFYLILLVFVCGHEHELTSDPFYTLIPLIFQDKSQECLYYNSIN